MVLMMVGHRDRFSIPLGFIVHTSRPDWVDVAPIGLRLGVHLRIPIHFGGGGQENHSSLCFGQPEGVIRSEGAHFQRVDGMLLVIFGTCRARKVQNVVQGALDLDRFRYIVLNEGKALLNHQVLDILGSPRQEVVHTNDLVALLDKTVAQVRSEEPRPAGHQRPCHPQPR